MYKWEYKYLQKWQSSKNIYEFAFVSATLPTLLIQFPANYSRRPNEAAARRVLVALEMNCVFGRHCRGEREREKER